MRTLLQLACLGLVLGAPASETDELMTRAALDDAGPDGQLVRVGEHGGMGCSKQRLTDTPRSSLPVVTVTR
eukprot:scaffold206880_cov32-Tisochrysis_lutea.AAC.3